MARTFVLVHSPIGRRIHEEEPVHGRTDRRDAAGDERGTATHELCRRHGISQQTLYRWKAKYGGLGVSDAQRLKALEDENRRLKKLVAEQALDNAALKDVLSRNW